MSGSVTTKKVKRDAKELLKFIYEAKWQRFGLAMDNSCIEFRRVLCSVNHGLRYSHGLRPLRQPHQVSKRFWNGVIVDISKTELIAWAGQNGSKLTDYPFSTLPSVGEGIILLHRKNLTGNYCHIHLVAVLAC